MLHIQRAGFASSKTKHGQGYGDMEGDPVASAPRSKQPVANKRQTSQEHPGPEPVDAGKGKGGDGANPKGSGGASGESPASERPANPGDASAESGGSRSKDKMEEHNEQEERGVSGGGGASSGGTPIMAEGSQHGKGGPKTQSDEVKKHNEEFENRGNYDNVQKEQERDSDAVDGDFWQGKSRSSYKQQPRRWHKGFFILPLPFGFVYKVNKHDREREDRNRRIREVNEYGDEVEREKQIEDGVVGDVYYEAT